MSGKRKSLSEYAAEAAQSQVGSCPRCGCNGPHKVINTYPAKGGKRRRMSCRNCHYGPIFSMEFIVPNGYHVELVPDNQ